MRYALKKTEVTAMKIEITGDGYEVDERIRTLINKKLQRLNKIFDKDTVCKLILKQEKTSYVMSVNIFADKVIRAEASSANMYDNIDLLIPKVTRQYRKEHTKTVAKAKDGAIPKKLFNNDLKDAQDKA